MQENKHNKGRGGSILGPRCGSVGYRIFCPAMEMLVR